MSKSVIKSSIKDVLLIVGGVLIAGLGLKGFLLPSGFIDGGITGVSLILNELSKVSVSVFLIVVNLPFMILAYFQLGPKFAIKSLLTIIGLAMAVHFLPYPVVTFDKILISAFGGFFLGCGIGLAMRGGAVLDGTEVLAIFLSRKTGMTIGDVILVSNLFIFLFGAYVLGIETAMYAILTYISASKTVDFIVRGVEEYTGVTIVSKYSEEIRKMITDKLGRGVTLYKGKGGYNNGEEDLKEYNIIFTVMTRLEIYNLQNEIEDIDPKAFVIMNSIKDTKGGMIKKLQI
ncbi:MAG: YitT family protein [Bdellovibrionales bacterium]|nr:YitT family protein [Bdellovibrionales bacterium]